MFAARRPVRCFLFVLTLILAGCQKSAVSANEPELLKDLPEQQKQFCQINARAKANGGSASADLNALLGASGNFVAWRGQGNIRPVGDGKTLAITFTPACPDPASSLSFETGRVDADDTSVPVGTRYANALQASDFSQGMIATGKLLRSSNGSSLIVRFSMLSPARFAPMTSSAASAEGALSGAEQQSRFCQILKNEPIARQKLESAAVQTTLRNPLNGTNVDAQKQALFSKMFDDLYALVGPSGTFTGWRGKFVRLAVDYSPNKPNKQIFVISFIPDCFGSDPYGRPLNILSLDTYRGPLEETHVVADSPLGQSLRQMDLSKPKYTVSGQFVWPPPPPKGGGRWVPAVDYRYHFESGDTVFLEGSYHFAVRFTQVSP